MNLYEVLRSSPYSNKYCVCNLRCEGETKDYSSKELAQIECDKMNARHNLIKKHEFNPLQVKSLFPDEFMSCRILEYTDKIYIAFHNGAKSKHFTKKLPLNVTNDWVIGIIKESKEYQYKSLAKLFSKIYGGYGTIYPTTYGIGVELIMMDRARFAQIKSEIETKLDNLGLKYKTEFSTKAWVFRYKISQSKETVNTLSNLK